MPTECTCPVDKMPFGRCCKAPTSSDVIAGLEMALAQAAAMIERQQHVMQRAMDAWDTMTHQKNGDGRLWQCMEELRGECGKQPNTEFDAMDDTDRGTLLANLTISLFRTCERDLTEESLDRLLDEIERDEPAEALH